MKPKYKRVLLKLSGETLLPEGESYGLSVAAAASLVGEVKPIVEKGVQVAIVIGGGNIFRGAVEAQGGGISQAQADTIGMLATIANALALEEAFSRAGVGCRVMTSRAMEGVAETFDRARAMAELARGMVLIFAGGTGNPFFSTDTAASLRALQINAEVILKGTKVDGVYSSDPAKDKAARFFEELKYMDVIERQLKVMDATAVSMCMDHKLPIIVFNVFVKENLLKAVCGAKLGTIVYG